MGDQCNCLEACRVSERFKSSQRPMKNLTNSPPWIPLTEVPWKAPESTPMTAGGGVADTSAKQAKATLSNGSLYNSFPEEWVYFSEYLRKEERLEIEGNRNLSNPLQMHPAIEEFQQRVKVALRLDFNHNATSQLSMPALRQYRAFWHSIDFVTTSFGMFQTSWMYGLSYY
eukprot:5641800-Amphidinium_carterae.2